MNFFQKFQKIYPPVFVQELLKDIGICWYECNHYIKITNDKTKNVEQVKKENEVKKKSLKILLIFILIGKFIIH